MELAAVAVAACDSGALQGAYFAPYTPKALEASTLIRDTLEVFGIASAKECGGFTA